MSLFTSTQSLATDTQPLAPESELRTRVDRLQGEMREQGWAAVYLAAPASLTYFAGVAITPMERLVALIVPADGEPVLVVPSLEADAAAERAAGIGIRCWTDSEGPLEALADALAVAEPSAVALEKDAVNVTVFESLQELVGKGPFPDASPLVGALRVRKSAAEIAAIARAAGVLDACVAELPERLRPGRSEADLAAEVEALVRRHGGGKPPFETCVLGGPNAALPHGHPGPREFQAGDLVIVDFGTTVDGYCADIARTFAVGEPAGRAREIYEIVRRAQEAACRAVRAGVACGEIDAAAREIIESEGYGPQFVHRTGHGIGLDVHEAPYLVGGSSRPLESGNVVTVEPGIYLPGALGVRIEDDIAVEEDGARVLTNAARELVVCPA